MQRTSYSTLTDDELIALVEMRDNRTEIEIELKQRLELALDELASAGYAANDGEVLTRQALAIPS